MSLKNYYTISKMEGETPLQALDRLRFQHSIPKETPLAYAGRLDPMASGKLLVLAGEECKRQKEYHSLDKEYVFEILFGFTTDTGDILGISLKHHHAPPTVEEIAQTMHTLPRTLALPYPIFSSKTVRGKPLFLWTLENRLSEITIPTAHTNIYTLTLKNFRTISGGELKDAIKRRIAQLPHVTEDSKKLGADFRRTEILAQWQSLLEKEAATPYTIAQFSTIVSSGTYIRSLAPFLAERIKNSGLAFSIHRTKIGRYTPLTKTLGFWWKNY